MTHDEALGLRVGQYLSTKHEFHKKARRITALWVNEDRTIVRIRLFSHETRGQDWITPEDWERHANPHIRVRL